MGLFFSINFISVCIVVFFMGVINFFGDIVSYLVLIDVF